MGNRKLLSTSRLQAIDGFSGEKLDGRGCLATLPRPARASRRTRKRAAFGVGAAIFGIPGGLEVERVSEVSCAVLREWHWRGQPPAAEAVGRHWMNPTFQVKGLILAQNERWRRG